MPELPEVETVRKDLLEWQGAKLVALKVRDPKVWFQSDFQPKRICENTLHRVGRRGKYLTYEFDQLTVVQHLRMTGKMLPTDSEVLPQKRKGNLQLRAEFVFEDKPSLFFFDTRRFGTLTGVEDLEAFWQKKGQAPDPIAGDYSLALDHYLEHIFGRARPIKSALLDQSIVSGVGNIYADEALHRVGIHPETLVKRLSTENLKDLFSALIDVFTEAIEKRGTTASDYLDVNGNPGVFRKYLRVYRNTGEDCKTCGKAKVERIKVGGRSSHYCPRCQRPPRAID